MEFLNDLWGLGPSWNRIVVPARPATQAGGIGSLESIPGILNSLKIRALNISVNDSRNSELKKSGSDVVESMRHMARVIPRDSVVFLHLSKSITHRLNMEISKVYLGSMCRAVYSLAETPQTPPPPFWAHIQGRYWSAKKDDISL